MDPVAFNLFGMEVRWYGVIISAAMIIGVLLAIRNGKRGLRRRPYFRCEPTSLTSCCYWS